MGDSDIIRYGDAAMFEAQPMLVEEGARVTPRVFLLSATPDPLGSIAAGFRMYAGQPTYSLAEITRGEREDAWEESLKTHLKAPWEFVDFHFFIEAVTRSFTHQMVRQRTAVYAQESLRFAVKRGFASEVALPPSVVGDEDLTAKWTETVTAIQAAYETLIGMGVPAEDARGLLPHCVTTRLNYKTNLRNLVETLGVRLCTQAQFEWRAVAIGIVRAIREYGADQVWREPNALGDGSYEDSSAWQFQTIAKPVAQTFTPVCYKAGKCVFMGKLDRGCTIRERVNQFARTGIPAEKWGQDHHIPYGPDEHGVEGGMLMYGIRPEEWLANPWAGLTESDEDRPS